RRPPGPASADPRSPGHPSIAALPFRAPWSYIQTPPDRETGRSPPAQFHDRAVSTSVTDRAGADPAVCGGRAGPRGQASGAKRGVVVAETLVPGEVRRWRAFSLLAVSFLMTVIDLTIVNVALTTIGRKLHFPQPDLQWVVTAYALTYGGFLLLGGRAADLLGRRRLFMTGLAIFTAASLACALATGDTFLIIMRGLQGLGAAVVLPAALSIVMNMFSEGAERNKALGAWGGIGATAATAGLLAGWRPPAPVRRLAVHLLPERADRRGRPAAGPAGRAGKQAAQRPPPLRPARRRHRDRRPRAPGLCDLAGAHCRLGVGPDAGPARYGGGAAGRLPGHRDQGRSAAAPATPGPAAHPRDRTSG